MTAEQIIADVNIRCAEFLKEKRREIAAIRPSGEPLAESLLRLTEGGKKLRPVLAWIGWRAAGGEERSSIERSALIDLGVALELFQAAALIHDDVIDRSSTRRGQPSTHIHFEGLHAQQKYAGSPEHFGISAAVLTGDLALSWSQEAFDTAVTLTAESSPAHASTDDREGPQAHSRSVAGVRQIFRQMHTEVIAGQYLDVLAEVSAAAETEEQALDQARTVLTFKAAKYSSEYPVTLGAQLAGADSELSQTLAAAALPVGRAFQLRDDLLGVFGDPEVTGKPVGDDLREGKRTELIAYGLFGSSTEDSRQLESMLGRSDLSDEEVATACTILRESGAEARVEESISQLQQQSEEHLRLLSSMGVAGDVISDFRQISQRLVNRHT